MTAAQALMLAAPAAPRPALADELEALAMRLRRITVRIHSRGSRFDGIGAGVLWAHDGQPFVVTNAHIVPPRRRDTPRIELFGDRVREGRVVARERERDLALLALDAVPDEWPAPAFLGGGSELRTGEIVVALGHPFGVPGALSVGVVHAAPGADDRWLLADIRLAPGNSGGPLATLDGTVIGINAMIVRGLGIAVPAIAVRAFVHRTLGIPDDSDG